MPVACHPERWWKVYMSEEEKKEVEPIFIEKFKMYVCSVQYGGIETFCLLRYWNILSSKFIKILNYVKSLCIIFMINWLKYFDQKSANFLSKNVSIPHVVYY